MSFRVPLLRPSLTRSCTGLFFALFLGSWPVLAQPSDEAQSTPIYEHWYAMSLKGVSSGHTVGSRYLEDWDGRQVVVTRMDSTFVVSRMGKQIRIQSTLTEWEDVETLRYLKGKVSLDLSSQPSETEVIVDGDKATRIHRIGKRETVEEIEWNPEVRGAYAVQRLLDRLGPEKETKISYLAYNTDVAEITTSWLEWVGQEELKIGDEEFRAKHYKAWNESAEYAIADEWYEIDSSTNPLIGPKMLKSYVDHPALEVTTVLATQEAALAYREEEASEIFVPLSPASNVLLASPYQTEEAQLRITALRPEFELPSFEDQRQTQEPSEDAGSTVIRIRSAVPPPEHRGQRPISDPDEALADTLRPTPMLQSDDPKLVEAAQKAIGSETDSWRAAQALELFVYHHISNKNMGVGFASASEVFETCEGDCSEHGVLLAALCRAVGIPSRVAVGLVYFNGVFGGHMWTEVYVDGQWYALDATLGKGRVSALHFAMSKSALTTTGLNDSFEAVNRALGNLDIDILELKTPERHLVLPLDGKPYQVDGNLYQNSVLNLSFKKPDGWDYEHLDPKGLQPILCVMSEEAHDAKIVVKVNSKERGLNLHQVLDSLQGRNELEIELDISRRIDGCEGRLVFGKRGGGDEASPFGMLVIDREDAILILEAVGDYPRYELLGLLNRVANSMDLDSQPLATGQ